MSTSQLVPPPARAFTLGDPTASGETCLIWRPSGVSTGPVVFSSLIALDAQLAILRAAASGDGCFKIAVDFSGLPSGIATAPVASYNFTSTKLVAYSAGGRLDFADGCSVIGMVDFADFIDVRNLNTTAPLVVLQDDPLGVVIRLDNNAGIESANAATQPFYDVATNSVSLLVLAVSKASRIAPNNDGPGGVFGGTNVGSGFQSGAVFFPQVYDANPVQPPLGGTHRPNAIQGAAGSILFPQVDSLKIYSSSIFPSFLGLILAPQITSPSFLTPNPFQAPPATSAVTAAHGEGLSLSGTFAQALPAISGDGLGYGFPGGLFAVNELSGVGVITLVAAGGDTINGLASYVMTAGGGVMLQSDGVSNWQVLSAFVPVTAHSALTGLTTGDDHTQYLLLAGRAGGQVVGATAPGLILSIQDSGAVERFRLDDNTDAALLALTSTGQGFRPPIMTEAERDAIATPGAGLLVYNTDQSQLNQHNGTLWSVPGGGLTTLQGAYDNNPAGAQILLDAAPNPFTVQAAVAGTVFAVKDIAGNNILQVNADFDFVEVDGQLTIRDSFLNGAALNSILLADTFSTTGAFVGGGILSNGTVTYTNSFFIWALLQESKVYRATVAPSFAAFTLFNALAVIENGANVDLVQAITLNVGVGHNRTTSGTSTVISNAGLNFSPAIRALISGAVMTRTNCNAVNLQPTFNTVAGGTVNLGTIRGLNCVQPSVQLFGSQLGVENMTAYYGVDFANMTFGGASAVYSVIRSLLASGTNKRFLDHTGNAVSRLRGQLLFDVDLVGVTYGASGDWQTGWGGAGFFFEQSPTGSGGQLRKSNPSLNRWLYTSATPTLTEFNFECLKFSLGAQSGANGNTIGNFVAGATSVAIGGEFSQFLLTQAGNVTADAALSGVFGWTVNAPSITLGTGTVTTAGALNVGGNVNQGSVNRFGVRILSNPAGGSAVNAALWVTAGLTRLDGRLDINQPIALGGGAAPTLGTIGGTGPTAAAQAQWVEIDINGVPHWLPAWT